MDDPDNLPWQSVRIAAARRLHINAARVRRGGGAMSGALTIRFASDMPAATVEVVSPDLEVIQRVMLDPGRSTSVQVPSEASFLRVHLPSGQVVTLKDPGNLTREVSLQSIQRRLPGSQPLLEEQLP